MKLSNETLTILKNFSSINQGIQFKKGTKLSTVSATKTVLAQATLKDDFPQEFCVYDLNQFLSVYSINKDVELEFDEKHVYFKSGKRKTNYRVTPKEMIVTPPDKELKLGSIDCTFDLTSEDYAAVLKAASILSSPHIAVHSDGKTVELVCFDASDDSAHNNSIEVAQGNGEKYKIVFKTENLKMIPGSYKVEISFKGISHFKNTAEDIQYWIAFESKESKV